jgi:Mrp family chromosome partitioning ATPase
VSGALISTDAVTLPEVTAPPLASRDGDRFRMIAVRLERILSGRGRIVIVTSPTPGDGKTTTATHLAQALASFGGRVLLLDERSELTRNLAALRARYDWVLVDTPALSRSVDAAILAREADGVLLVVRAGRTSKPTLRSAVEALTHTRIVGCVLNEKD